MSRPCTLTDEKENKIISALRIGSYIDVACRASGISKSTFYFWLEKASDQYQEYNNPRYKAFAAKVDKAMAEAEIYLLNDVRKKGQGWQASMTIMERRWPERWGQKAKVETNATVTINYKPEDLTDEQLAIIASRGIQGTIKAPQVTPSLN
jgi:hypothetical protein